MCDPQSTGEGLVGKRNTSTAKEYVFCNSMRKWVHFHKVNVSAEKPVLCCKFFITASVAMSIHVHV